MGELSLIDGRLPIAVQVASALVVVVAIGWRTRMWSVRWAPIAVLAGLLVVSGAYWFYHHQALGEGSGASPFLLWLWIAVTGVAIAVAIIGWPGATWCRRTASLVAIPLCVLCVALSVNAWTGYLPTVSSVWNRSTGASLPTQVDEATALDMQRRNEEPDHGVLVSVTTPSDVSGFQHRDELVYLPPAWFASSTPPALPAVLMLGGEYGHPTDWPTTGEARRTADEFAAAHGGNAPILVFADTSGKFSNDTECVNGVRGNAADHLTKEVVPYVISRFGASPDPAHWGIVGWSSGGTCALMTTVMHPEMFSIFVDIDGLMGPSAGSKGQTVARLFGGDADGWAAFDPATVMKRHGPYQGPAGWFSVAGSGPVVYQPGRSAPPQSVDRDHFDPADGAGIANYLCALASSTGIECAVVPRSGDHDFGTAGEVFAQALPWLAGRLGTPEVPRVALPGAP